MPLPQEVINQLSEERSATPGWSSGLLFFGLGLAVLMVLLYAGIVFGYEPYVNGQIQKVSTQMASLNQSVASGDVASLVSLYSQTVQAESLLRGHVFFSQFLTWLGSHTEANAYYTSLTFASGNQVTLAVLTKSEADINQQIAIFENDPDVASIAVSSVSLASVSGFWQTNVTLTMKPSMFMAGTN